jgi:hypothetical protein
MSRRRLTRSTAPKTCYESKLPSVLACDKCQLFLQRFEMTGKEPRRKVSQTCDKPWEESGLKPSSLNPIQNGTCVLGVERKELDESKGKILTI